MTTVKGIFIGTAIILLLILGGVLLYPMPLYEFISESDDLIVYHTTVEIDQTDGSPRMETKEYHFDGGTEKIQLIRQILSTYSYHRGLRYFGKDGSMEGGSAGIWIQLYSGENSIASVGTKEISINNRVGRIGYWGNKESRSLISEILTVLE